jgi:hypothetical protein
MERRYGQKFGHSLILDPRSTFLDPRSTSHDPRSTFLDPPSSSMFPDHRSTFLDPLSTFLGPILDTRLPSQCRLLDPRAIPPVPLLFCACAVRVARDQRPRQREAAPITLKLGAEEIRKQWTASTLF